MTRLAQVVFAALVVATFGAFFAAQELKSQPGAIVEFRREPLFSPNQDGRKERATVRFELRRADTVTLTVVDADDDPVRELIRGERFAAFHEVRARWDGRDDDGERVPDGLYRFRVTLQEQGRSIVVPAATRLDTTPPSPRILSVGPEREPGAELLPRRDGQPARISYDAPGRQAVIRIFRTAPGATRLVLERDVPEGRGRFDWDGTVDGRRVGPGTYLAVIESRDQAGNIGRSVELGEEGLPRLPFGEALPGRGGIEVRYLAARPPLDPVVAGEPVDLLLDARGQPFTWSVRRVGGAPVRRSGGEKTRPIVRLRTPAGRSGLFLFEVRSGTRTARAPFVVDDRADNRVLVVLPLLSLQGRNPVDDDGDGAPDTLERGVDVRLNRVLVRETESFVRREAPLLAWLDRQGYRYDLTTDVALAAGRGPRLDGRRGVLLPGDARWLPGDLQRRLRRFVEGGGVLVNAGIDSLRRSVDLTPRRRAVDPTAPAPADLFGARLGPVARGEWTLTNAVDDLGLFALPTTEGTAGVFGGITAVEPVRGWGRLVASAETEAGTPVVAAARIGEGTVIRFGLPDIAARTDDPQVEALLERSWTLLSR
jgi:flagellar hook assembly protein FlgD